MFPLKDSIKSSTFPYVNSVIIIVNFIVYFYQTSLGSKVGYFFVEHGLVPVKIFLPFEVVSFWEKFTPFFSSMFLHGSFMHIAGNMYFLYIFGDNAEDVMGHYRYLVMYILFGVCAAVVQVVLYPHSNIPTIGASGAVSGVMGYYFLKFPYAKIKTLVFIIIFITIVDVPAVIFLGFWFFIQFLNGSAEVGYINSAGGVAWWAHIGGFLAGVFYAILDKKRLWFYSK